MKQFIISIIITALLPFTLFAQDSIPKPGSFDEGYFLVGPDDVLKFKGYAQFDGYFPVHNSPGFSEFLVRRARLAVTGFFQKKFRYMLNVGFDKGKADLREAFLESRHLSFAKVRAGQFKVPFSLSNLQSDAQIDFISRSFIVDNFSPSYDIGAMVFGDEKLKHFDYAFGVFNGRGLNQPENNNHKYIIGRVQFAPFISSAQSAFSKFYIGASLATGKQNNDMSKMTYNTVTDVAAFTFNDSVKQNGKTTIYGYDMAWYIKRFSLQVEYLHYKGERLTNKTSSLNLLSEGYYIAATFLLTGEDKKRNEFVKPKKEVDPGKGAWGAFELAARYEQATLSKAALTADFAKGSDRVNSWIGGINWYLNDDVKVVFNYSACDFKKIILINDKLYRKSNTLLLRVQYQF